MFYILITIGLVFIGLGIYVDKDRKPQTIIEEIFKAEESIEKKSLEERISILEKRLDNHINNIKKQEGLKVKKEGIKKENKPPTFETIAKQVLDERLKKNTRSLNPEEKVKLIKEYEKEGFSIEDICELLDINKGEVLLLKNLYKD